METTFELVAVAFLRASGGAVRVLLAIDRDGEQLFDGEPALLLEHRPGHPAAELTLECAELLDAAAVARLADAARDALVGLVEAAFDEDGGFDGTRMLGRSVAVSAPRDSFEV